MSAMTRMLRLDVVAEHLGFRPSYLRRIAADQGRPQTERRYPEHVHERFPLFVKDGHCWKVPEHILRAHFERRGRDWTPRL